MFKAKYYEGASAKQAIADALAEADKIATYKQPGHSHFAIWQQVQHWRLVANDVFNSTADQRAWDETIVPRFAKLGIVADYWGQRELGALLDKFPWVDRAFFENVRAFLSLVEVRERAASEEPSLRRAADSLFVGRTNERALLREFLAGDELFVVVSGAAGVGKTRLLLEISEEIAAEGEWQVLWANIATLSLSASWFEAIVPERATILIVDDPEDPSVLQVLADQLAARVGRLARWKIAIGCRSTNDPVLRYLRGARKASQVREISLGALERADSVKMTRALLEGRIPDTKLDETATTIWERFQGHPIWITLAAHHIEQHGDWRTLPSTDVTLAREYIREVVETQESGGSGLPRHEVESVLRWLALAGNINSESTTAMQQIARSAGIKDDPRFNAIVAHLITRRALITRGAKGRIVEVKPDVIRDHILADWLTARVDFRTNNVTGTAASSSLALKVWTGFDTGTFAFPERIALTGLARTELLLTRAGIKVDLLAPFFDRVHGGLASLTASKRIALVEILQLIAPFRPRDIISCCRWLRMNEATPEHTESALGPNEVRQRDVVLVLPWLCFHAALGADSASTRDVLEELCSLVAAERDVVADSLGRLPNDGKRAVSLVQRVVDGGPQFVSTYDEAGRVIALRLLAELSSSKPSPGVAALVEALVLPLVSVERNQSWSSDRAIHWRRYVVPANSLAWRSRIEILQGARDLLERESTPVESRLLLWRIVVDAHKNLNAANGTDTAQRHTLLDDLRWAHSALDSNHVELEELRIARDLWDWHRKFQRDEQLKQESTALEERYQRDQIVSEFDTLLTFDNPGAMDARFLAKAQQLADADADDIERFLLRGLRFVGSTEVRRLLGVARCLGRFASEHAGARAFIHVAIGGTTKEDARATFAAEMLRGWLWDTRSSRPEQAASLVRQWLTWCKDDDARALVLEQLFASRGAAAKRSPDEERILRESSALFVRARRGASFVACVSTTFTFDWPQYTACLEGVLDALEDRELTHAVCLLVEGIDFGLQEAQTAKMPQLAQWLLDQAMRLPDLDALSGNTQWHFDRVMNVLDRVPTTWLVDALRRRDSMEAAEGYLGSRGIGYSFHLAQYVQPLRPDDPSAPELVADLLSFQSSRGSVGYALPSILRDLDPPGDLVANAIATRIARGGNYERLWQITRLAESYAVGTKPWRVIARAVVGVSGGLSERERRSLFHELGDPAPRSWSGTPGEVPPAFVSALEAARTLESASDDELLRPFWRWYVSAAELALEDATERAKEQRGE